MSVIDSMTNMPPGVVSRKVYGAAGAGTLGVVTSDLVLGLLDDHVYDPTTPGSVPGYIAAFIVVAIQLAFTFTGGYFTKRGRDETTTQVVVEVPTDTDPLRRAPVETGEH